MFFFNKTIAIELEPSFETTEISKLKVSALEEHLLAALITTDLLPTESTIADANGPFTSKGWQNMVRRLHAENAIDFKVPAEKNLSKLLFHPAPPSAAEGAEPIPHIIDRETFAKWNLSQKGKAPACPHCQETNVTWQDIITYITALPAVKTLAETQPKDVGFLKTVLRDRLKIGAFVVERADAYDFRVDISPEAVAEIRSHQLHENDIEMGRLEVRNAPARQRTAAEQTDQNLGWCVLGLTLMFIIIMISTSASSND
ncbi:MAG: hypothetical protein ACI9BD_000664 [Candidatus Marinamargulisbacteria bacterium]